MRWNKLRVSFCRAELLDEISKCSGFAERARAGACKTVDWFVSLITGLPRTEAGSAQSGPAASHRVRCDF